MLDSLTKTGGGPQPYKIAQMSDKTREAILRALARGVTPGTISSKLASTPDAVDAKTIRRWIKIPEVAARLAKMKKERA